MSIEALILSYNKQLEGKEKIISALLQKIDSLEESNRELAATIKDQNASIHEMAGELSKLRRMLFGTKSEKTHAMEKDGESGGDAEVPSDAGPESTNTKCADKNDCVKKCYKRPERREYGDIEPEKFITIKPNDEDIKGAKLLKVTHTYKFYYIPGKLCKVRIDRHIYYKDGHLITPPLPYAPESFEKRHVDPSLSAWILTAKYYYHMPYERVLKMLNASGKIKIAKTTLYEWATAGIDAIEGLYDAIRRKVLSDWHINVDETVQKLLDESAHRCRNIYDWGFVSKTHKLMYFKTYVAGTDDGLRDGSRGQRVIDEEIHDFKGSIIQSDGYRAYEGAGERAGKNIINIFCMAHLRRYFFDALPYNKKLATEGLWHIGGMYSDEGEYKKLGLSPKKIEALRAVNLRKKLDDFRKWLLECLNSLDFLEGDVIGKAVRYAWDRIDSFYILIKHGELDLDNNLAERSMRGHTLGRKNYNFCRNIIAADRTCKMYTIMESCKLSNIDPYKYLYAVMTREPKFGETWDDLLPCCIKL